MLDKSGRDEIIFAITLSTKYSEAYLQTLNDKELLKLYERVMALN